MGPTEPEETRAEIARRRLAELAASFNATLSEPDDSTEIVEIPEAPSRRRLTGLHVRLLAAAAALVLAVTAWWLLSHRTTVHEDPAVSAVAVTDSPEDPEYLIIDVVGKVKNPGIVTVPPGSRVHEAITAAGGTRGDVDVSDLNLARELSDGEQLRIGLPAVESVDPATSSPSSNVNLNTATAAELETLPGVGPATSQAILTWREQNGRFRTVEDLLAVRGIGEATLERLRELVTV